MNKLVKQSLTIVVILILALIPTQVFANEDGEISLDEVIGELGALEPYVSEVNKEEFTTQTLNDKQALEDGFHQEVIVLAWEMIEFQNELASLVNNSAVSDVSKVDISLGIYPNLEKFFYEVSQRSERDLFAIESGVLVTRDVDPCGDWDHPIPSYSPTRHSYTSSDPHQAFLNLGYHRTSGYACGGSIFYSCAEDYTRGRSYTSSYGTCSSPRFRNHGRVTSTGYSIQYGEPNPEILGYSWPYWNWGAYVWWWHQNY